MRLTADGQSVEPMLPDCNNCPQLLKDSVPRLIWSERRRRRESTVRHTVAMHSQMSHRTVPFKLKDPLCDYILITQSYLLIVSTFAYQDDEKVVVAHYIAHEQ